MNIHQKRKKKTAKVHSFTFLCDKTYYMEIRRYFPYYPQHIKNGFLLHLFVMLRSWYLINLIPSLQYVKMAFQSSFTKTHGHSPRTNIRYLCNDGGDLSSSYNNIHTVIQGATWKINKIGFLFTAIQNDTFASKVYATTT